jgi:PAS domain S-box-containing protein
MNLKEPDLDHLLQFRSITESASDAIVCIDSSGLIFFWNSAASALFGFTGAEVIGTNIEVIIPEQHVQAHRHGMNRALTTGQYHVIGKTVELIGKRKDGLIFPIELSLSAWKTEAGQFFGGIIRDITERKLQEKLLHESENKFRFITETANDAIISANDQGKIISWNKAAEKIFGYSQEEAAGRSLDMIVPERFREAHNKGMARISKGGSPRVIGKTVELSGLHKNSTEFPIELSLSTWVIEGERHFCGIIRDITRRKIAENALKKSEENLKNQAEKLKQANAQINLKNEQLQGLSQKLAKYLSQQVYNSIFEGNKDVKIESYRKKLTIFFSDIQGFTELSDRVESEVLTNVLNSYLNEMSKIAHKHGGTIDKFIGDAIMIFFGDPESRGNKQDAMACLEMALDMRNQLKSLHREWDSWGVGRPLKVRMGINTGFCTVGNFGSEERMDYTIVGSQVNLASRLESAAEPNQILISHDTYVLVKDVVACIKKDEVKVKGIAYPVQSYQVIDLKKNLKTRDEQLISELNGFKISLNASQLAGKSKEQVRDILEKALALLD